MANDLVSEQMMLPSTQMVPIRIQENSSVNGLHMKSLVPVYSESLSLQYPGPDAHLEMLSARPQGLPVSMMQTMGIGSPNYQVPHQFARQAEVMHGVGSQQMSATLKRKALLDPSPVGLEPQLSAMSMKRVSHMEHRPWLQQVSMSNMSSIQMNPPASAPWHQNVHPPNKKKSQTEFLPVKLGLPRSANSKGHTARLQQSSKGKPESCESVRSKMRESLASALTLISLETISKAGNSTNDKEATDRAKADMNSQVSLISAEAESNKGKCAEISRSDEPVVVPIGAGLMPGEHAELSASPVEASAITYDNEKYPSLVQKSDRQDLPSSYVLSTDDIPFSEGFFVKDELLQGNGLSWVLESDMGVLNQEAYQSNEVQMLNPDVGRNYEEALLSPDYLASKIEAELFKLFGGVNKKYKEKGRSLLFNLKDHNNPELRERVISGKILPQRLCSMTAEELASKELSLWRIAKAEELAQMVVLPDSDVDIRRLVRKTHKGEFQVEVEYDDNASVEFSGGASLVGQKQSEVMEGSKESSGNHSKVGDKVAHLVSDGRSDEAAKKEESALEHDGQCSVTIPSNSAPNLIQGTTTDNAMKDAEFLPPIVSLDEFMESLASDSPFESIPEVSGKKMPKKDDPDVGTELKSSNPIPSGQVDRIPDKLNSPCMKVEKDLKPSCSHPNKDSGVIHSDHRSVGDGAERNPVSHSDKMSSNDTNSSTQAQTTINVNNAEAKSQIYKGESVWEGSLQLNISASDSVIGIFKSGEKASTKEWPGTIEIKGRVRLDAFEKFLLQLPMSRSRAVMVVHFVSKEGENSKLREVADSYIVDDRVGFAEAAPAVELYFCPAHKKSIEMLGRILPKEQVEGLYAIDIGLIGVTVWRKTHLTCSISPTSSSQKLSVKKQHLTSRRRHDSSNITNVNTPSAAHAHSGYMTSNAAAPDVDTDDDIPPGFGPGAPASKEEDDLPEFNFSGGSNASHVLKRTNELVPRNVSHIHPRAADQLRDLVHKYGQPQTSADTTAIGVQVQPWNDEDDDIPEWQPDAAALSHARPLFQLRPHRMSPSNSHLSVMQTRSLQSSIQGQPFMGTQWAPTSQGDGVQPTGNCLGSQASVEQVYGGSGQRGGRGRISWRQNVSRNKNM